MTTLAFYKLKYNFPQKNQVIIFQLAVQDCFHNQHQLSICPLTPEWTG